MEDVQYGNAEIIPFKRGGKNRGHGEVRVFRTEAGKVVVEIDHPTIGQDPATLYFTPTIAMQVAAAMIRKGCNDTDQQG